MAGVSKTKREWEEKLKLLSDWTKLSSGVRRFLLDEDDKWKFVTQISVQHWQYYLEILHEKGMISDKEMGINPGWIRIENE